MSKSSGNRNNGEDAFREWLSDHLRYLVFLIALLLAIVVIIMAVSLLDNRQGSSRQGADGNSNDVVIMSETAQQAETASSNEASSEAAPAAARETEPASDSETEEKAESETALTAESETEIRAASETEVAAESETEIKAVSETEVTAESETEAKPESETALTAESETEAKPESETEVTAESETEAEPETETEEETESETEAESEEKTGKKATSAKQDEDRKKSESKLISKTTGKTTTSSTEKTVKAPSDPSKKTETQALAGYGSETEAGSTDSGTITVTSSKPVKRITALVSGGSSSGNSRAMITNMDTGTTIGAYQTKSTAGASAGSDAPVTVSASGDTDSSGGLVAVDPAADQYQADGSGSDIEIVGQETWEPEPAPSPTYRTIISACNIRSYPDYGDNVIGGLGGGETVLFYGEEAGWYKIEYNGIVGYIGPRFLQ